MNIYPVKGYSVTIDLKDQTSKQCAPTVSLIDQPVKIVASRRVIDLGLLVQQSLLE